MSAFGDGERFEIDVDENEEETTEMKQNPGATGQAEQAIGSEQPFRKKPIVILVIGMAGSGKTTLMHRINLHMIEKNLKGYYVNLDPAVNSVPFAANIDIRDTVNYKEVMKQYGLGPNGGILTSLNLFATRFDQVLGILERRADDLDYIFIDTPGQIEVFTWSAGGQIIHELLASSFPTTILYITDTPRSISPTTFMSNMLYACSVLYKSRLPMVLAFNKVDAVPCEFAEEWMGDFESFQDALDGDNEEYMGSLNRSLSLVLDEFYRNIATVGVSAATGKGINSLFEKIDGSVEEFETSYLPDLQQRESRNVRQQQRMDEAKQEADLQRLAEDMKGSSL
jgi:GTPase SAR1 family protein